MENTEKSNNSSFEDLGNLNEEDPDIIVKQSIASDFDNIDVIGNKQLTKRVIQKGTSNIQPQRGDLVKINLTGKLEDGTEVENFNGLEIHVGDFEVVQGLDMVLALMKVGEIAEVHVDPRFAYGTIGLKTNSVEIPPNAKIIYRLELLEARDETEEELATFQIRKSYGNRKRERANFWYNRNEFNIAIQVYRRALVFLDDTETGITVIDKVSELSNRDLQELLDDRLIVYNNLAMAQIKIAAYEAALKSVENVLRCQPNNSKALYRKGRILEAKGDTKGAISLFQKAATLEPDSKTIQQDLAKLILKSRRQERNEKELYQKMLGQAKKLDQSNMKTKSTSADVPKLRLLGYLMGSILIGVAGVAMYRYKY